jgi:hypothetical protein
VGSRPYLSRRDRQLRTRKQIKEQMIHQRNKFRSNPECVVAGDAFCEHWPSSEPLDRADVLFFHTAQKRYFFARLVTAKRKAYEEASEFVSERLNELHPFPDEMFDLAQERPIRGKNGKIVGCTTVFTTEFQEACKMRDLAAPALFLEKARETLPVALQWRVSDVDAVGAYIDAVLDASVITEEVMRHFIAEFRALGEPFYPCIILNSGNVAVPLSFATRPNASSAP